MEIKFHLKNTLSFIKVISNILHILILMENNYEENLKRADMNNVKTL